MKVSKFPPDPKVPGASKLPPWLEMTPVRSLVSRLGFMTCFALLSITRRYSAFSTGKQFNSIFIFPASAVFSTYKSVTIATDAITLHTWNRFTEIWLPFFIFINSLWALPWSVLKRRPWNYSRIRRGFSIPSCFKIDARF